MTTKVPPSELMFNRTVKGKLPILYKRNVVNKHKQARDNDKFGQEYNKEYADNRRKAKHRNITVGDCVLVRQKRQNKLTTNFSTTPYVVIATNKSRITAQSKDGHKVTRNVSHFKRIPGKTLDVDTDDDDEHPQKRVQNAEVGQNNVEPATNINASASKTRRSTRERRAPHRYGNSLPWR